MNKICTSLEQSKKLIELGIDVNTADMYHHYDEDFNEFDLPQIIDDGESSFNTHHGLFPDDIPCWSLAALLGVYPMVVGRDMDMYCCWQNSKNLHSRHYDNPVDACYEMILKLKEKNLL